MTLLAFKTLKDLMVDMLLLEVTAREEKFLEKRQVSKGKMQMMASSAGLMHGL